MLCLGLFYGSQCLRLLKPRIGLLQVNGLWGVGLGHNVVLHACTSEDEAFVGMGATILDGAVVEKGAMVAVEH